GATISVAGGTQRLILLGGVTAPLGGVVDALTRWRENKYAPLVINFCSGGQRFYRVCFPLCYLSFYIKAGAGNNNSAGKSFT
ncbi:MAG TPA: hypothetical protein PKO20_06935, partial [Clostridiales bacterium]|nr:hypothetical protein [Clostridiales bacterium]